MTINSINTTSSSPPPSPMEQLLDDFNQISALQEDMKKNPQNAMKDLQEMIGISADMSKIADKMPEPPSSHLHEDCEGLNHYLNELKSTYLDQTISPDGKAFSKDIQIEMGNLKFDILQG